MCREQPYLALRCTWHQRVVLGTVFVMLRGTRSLALCVLSLTAVTATAVPALHASEAPPLPDPVQLVRTLAAEALQNSSSAELAQVASDIAAAGQQAEFLSVLSGEQSAEPTVEDVLNASETESSDAVVAMSAPSPSEPRLLQLMELHIASQLAASEQPLPGQEPTLLPTVLPEVQTVSLGEAPQDTPSGSHSAFADPGVASSEAVAEQTVVLAPPVTNEAGAPARGSADSPPVTVPLSAQQLSEQENAKAYGSYIALASAVVDATGLAVEPLVLAAEWSRTTAQRRAAVFSALKFFGASYVANTTGPEEFDCSGLILTAWGSAGVTLSHWSASQQTEVVGTVEGMSRVGDLAFFEGGPTAGGALNIGHVVMVLSPGFLVEASPSHGVWVASFESKRAPVAWGAPAA